MIGNKNKLQKGLTLVELIVSTAIFAIIVMVVVGIFINSLDSKNKAYAFQDAQENARYVLESMAKEIRMSELISLAGLSSVIDITTHSAGGSLAVKYEKNGTEILRTQGVSEVITSSQVEVTDLQFNIVDGVNDHPKVTIAMTIKSIGDQSTTITLQTTVSLRSY